MKTSESIVNIAAALADMQSDKKVIGKSGENKFDKYSYAMLEDYIRETKDALAKHGFFIITSTGEAQRLDNRTTRAGGTEHAVQVKLTVRLMHKSGEWIEVECLGEGQDRADKAIYKAITGARKYAIASLLGLATSDDPEADEDVGLSVKNTDKMPMSIKESTLEGYVNQMRESKTLGELKVNFEAAQTFARTLGDQAALSRLISVKDQLKDVMGA